MISYVVKMHSGHGAVHAVLSIGARDTWASTACGLLAVRDNGDEISNDSSPKERVTCKTCKRVIA